MTLTSGAYHSGTEWPEVEAVPGVHRRVLSCGDQMMIVQFRIAQGAEVPLHTHPHEQIGHVVSGRLIMQIGDERRELGPGEGYSVPGGLQHGATGVTDAVVADSFHPVREDYR